MARADAGRRPFLGRWRITTMELWAAEDLDLLGPAHLTLERGGSGDTSFVAIDAGLDYRSTGGERLRAALCGKYAPTSLALFPVPRD